MRVSLKGVYCSVGFLFRAMELQTYCCWSCRWCINGSIAQACHKGWQTPKAGSETNKQRGATRYKEGPGNISQLAISLCFDFSKRWFAKSSNVQLHHNDATQKSPQ